MLSFQIDGHWIIMMIASNVGNAVEEDDDEEDVDVWKSHHVMLSAMGLLSFSITGHILASHALLNFLWLNFIIVLFDIAIFIITKIVPYFNPITIFILIIILTLIISFTKCACMCMSLCFSYGLTNIVWNVYYPLGQANKVILSHQYFNQYKLYRTSTRHLNIKHFATFSKRNVKTFSDLHFAVERGIIFPQDRIIVMLERGKISSRVLILNNLVNMICSLPSKVGVKISSLRP